jgi:hypothetical protein
MEFETGRLVVTAGRRDAAHQHVYATKPQPELYIDSAATIVLAAASIAD